MRWLLVPFSVVYATLPVEAASPSASFPGAQGYGAGAITTCNRSNVQVLTVSNLNSTGVGSLDQAFQDMDVDNTRLKIITFNGAPAGEIVLTPPNTFYYFAAKQCWYLAGQTQQGSGITLRSDSSNYYSRGASPNFPDKYVVRYIRLRGNNAPWITSQGEGGKIFDHLSMTWNTNSCITHSGFANVSWSTSVRNITYSRVLCAETLANFAGTQATGIFGGDGNYRVGTGSPPPAVQYIDLHHSLLASVGHRNPNTGEARDWKVVNNVIYNWNQGATESASWTEFDAIKNYYKAGPMTTTLLWEVTYNCLDAPPGGTATVSIHATGNIGPHNTDPNADNWSGASRMTACYYNTGPGSTVGAVIPNPIFGSNPQRLTPLADPAIPITQETANQAYTDIVTNATTAGNSSGVGANARLSCNGTWVTNMDSVDTKIVNDVINGTGPTSAPSGPTVAYPTYSNGTPCTISGGDGIPDAYKTRYGLTLTTNYASIDLKGDGYTVLENYLNGTSPR